MAATRSGAHGEDVAQDAADTGRRALIGLDVGAVWLWLSILKNHSLTVTDIGPHRRSRRGLEARAAPSVW